MVHNVKVDLKSDLFAYEIDARALKHAKMMDGKLLLVTNAPDFIPEEVVKRDGSLTDFERGFRITITVNTIRLFLQRINVANPISYFSPRATAVHQIFQAPSLC